jgi:acyl carrier protein
MQTTLDKVLAEFNGLVCSILNDPSVKLKCETTARDVPNWDSLNHIEIIVAAEKHFQIRFNFAELQKFNNVGEMCESIVAKVAKR